MTDQSDAKVEIPVWDGNREALPEIHQVFLYKDKKYLAFKFHGYLSVIDLEKESFSFGMEIRMTGAESSVTFANVLIKAGTATSEEVANAFEGEDINSFIALLRRFDDFLKKHRQGALKLLKSKGVTVRELSQMHAILAKAVIGATIADLFLS